MFTNIPSSTLRQLVKLSERKEALMAQIQEIDHQMVTLQNKHDGRSVNSGKPATVTLSPVSHGKSFGGRAKRGALKEKILRVLRAAGKNGATIKELSNKVGARNTNLYVWFNGTGKNVPGLRKIGTAKYRLG